MTIFDKVKAKNIELRKARDPLASVLGSAINLAQLNAKERALKTKTDINVSDEDIISALRKMIKQCDDMISVAPETSEQYQNATNEKQLLVSVLPQETSIQDIKEAIVTLMAGEDDFSMKHMGRIMTHLNEKFGTALNKATASQEVKKYLSTMNQ
ncbi:MAG: GatB/YqeY domain-containing protein [Gammaproteobacteria bacterium]|nr:GatB/YqeY domain-containing protein [Gammaproteobacteria bacterium]